jgi:hypothetical protein
MWSVVSLVMFVAAIVGVFVEIPIVSDYAFWVMVAATIISSVPTPHEGLTVGR